MLYDRAQGKVARNRCVAQRGGYIIMLVLDRPAEVTRAAFDIALRAHFQNSDITFDKDDGGADVMAMYIDRQLFFIRYLSFPIPEGTLDGATSRNLAWNDAAEDLAQHRAHVIVSGLGDQNDLASHMRAVARVIDLCELLIKLTSTLGVYFCNPEAVYQPTLFLECMKHKSPDKAVIELCIRLHFFQRETIPNAIGCWTTGLFDLVGREIEFEPAPLNGAQLAEHVLGAARLLTEGSIFEDGDTMSFENGKGDKIAISLADKGEIVIHPTIRMRVHRGYA